MYVIFNKKFKKEKHKFILMYPDDGESLTSLSVSVSLFSMRCKPLEGNEAICLTLYLLPAFYFTAYNIVHS